ncbi:phosphotransferase family enzyme [Bradyrhizobium macuxiense]|uniref:Phosphotransferase family enzyme n=1 Tax=Bradyrhizobium macuxiense TaxID=1755647 RepID=A0A560KVL3_9BRAD|nr:aminoglycoside phosphotransferase family protein [Bradyrhizobium macuxiense]TWB87273.1 phosphotransferase family enzyme [Bradyrhizobium macuxiense]
MLSKLRYARVLRSSAACGIIPAQDVARLSASLGSSAATLIKGGTLGAAFLVLIDGRQRVAKTNAFTGGEPALRKEGALLSALYGERLHVQTVELGARFWLVTDALSHPPCPPTGELLRALIASWSRRLNDPKVTAAIPDHDDFATLLREGQAALSGLISGAHIHGKAQGWASACLDLLEDEQHRFVAVPCHGDLGARNLMIDSGGLVAIDWEDALWGIEGYDYLYWLTFMAQRPHYSPTMFGHTPWKKEVEIAVLILIIVLKSWLSVLFETHGSSSLDFNRRVLEIVAFASDH